MGLVAPANKMKKPEKLLSVSKDGPVFYLANQQRYHELDTLKAGVYQWRPAGMTDIADKFIFISDKLDIGHNSMTNNEVYAKVKREVDKLVQNVDWFDKLKSSCRRGFMLYGPPGTGKTTVQKEVVNKLIEEYNAIAIQCSLTIGGWEGAQDWILNYRKEYPEENKRLVVFSFGDLNSEDFSSSSLLSDFREFLETFMSGPVVYFATTNEFDKLDPSISCRPGRFDTRILIESMPFDAFKSVCAHFHIEQYADAIYAYGKTATPALLKEIATKIHCFEMDPQEAISISFKEFDPSEVYKEKDKEDFREDEEEDPEEDDEQENRRRRRRK